jgi:hypothetical protein
VSESFRLSGVIRARAGAVEFALLAAAGVALHAYGAVTEPGQALSGLLSASFFAVTVALGAAVFAAIHGVSGARWWAPVRPVAAALAGTLALPASALFLTLVLGLKTLYRWARPGAAEASHALGAKAAWLNPGFFLARALVVLVLWTVLASLLRSRLAALDERPSAESNRAFARASVLFLLLLAPTLSAASWDWAMSLEPEWFSTMFSVYVFSGTFLGGIAAIAVLAIWMDGRGLLGRRLAPETLHDLGKLLFAFGTFWAYIWFCQYLLIWYSNLPEETPYFARRLTGGWTLLFWLNPVLNFGVPFAALLSAGVKRRPGLLAQVALVVLLGRWLDSYLLIAPTESPLPSFPVYAVVATLLLVSGMLLLFARLSDVRGTRVLPVSEPEMADLHPTSVTGPADPR